MAESARQLGFTLRRAQGERLKSDLTSGREVVLFKESIVRLVRSFERDSSVRMAHHPRIKFGCVLPQRGPVFASYGEAVKLGTERMRATNTVEIP